MNLEMQPIRNTALQFAAGVFIGFAVITTAMARNSLRLGSEGVGHVNDLVQTGQNPPPRVGESDRHRIENERDLEQRIWNLRMLSEQARHPVGKKPNVQQALAQMQEDFTRLQIVTKSLLRSALGNGPLDPKFVTKSVTEINKRAERLNGNLALPEPARPAERPKTDVIATSPQMKSSLMRLGRLIFSFIDNPFFKEISVVDTQLTTKARSDLEEIIELSGQIKRDSEKFKSAGEKPDH